MDFFPLGNILFLLAIWAMLAHIVAIFGPGRTLNYWLVFLICFFFTPIAGVVLISTFEKNTTSE